MGLTGALGIHQARPCYWSQTGYTSGQLVYLFYPSNSTLTSNRRKFTCQFVGPLAIWKCFSPTQFVLMSYWMELYTHIWYGEEWLYAEGFFLIINIKICNTQYSKVKTCNYMHIRQNQTSQESSTLLEQANGSCNYPSLSILLCSSHHPIALITRHMFSHTW